MISRVVLEIGSPREEGVQDIIVKAIPSLVLLGSVWEAVRVM